MILGNEGEIDHDEDAMKFCQGKDQGYYENPNDCNSFFFCWNDGLTGDYYRCDTGLVWNQRLAMCDWPYNLPEDHKCYEPLL